MLSKYERIVCVCGMTSISLRFHQQHYTSRPLNPTFNKILISLKYMALASSSNNTFFETNLIPEMKIYI